MNCNPLYTPRELEHQLKDPVPRPSSWWKTGASTLEAVISKTDEARDHHPNRRLAGFPEVADRKFCDQAQEKMVPAFNLPGSVPFKSALS